MKWKWHGEGNIPVLPRETACVALEALPITICDRCFDEGKTFEVEEDYHLCEKCLRELEDFEQLERELDPENSCIRCFKYSSILDNGKCPRCFEMDGYT